MDALRLPAKRESLENFRSFVVDRATRLKVSQELLFKIELVLEEALTNVIRYAYPEASGDVEIECTVLENKLCLSISDWGDPFNPLERPEPDLTCEMSERPIGGLGIYLIRHMGDEMHYTRQGHKNILSFCFRV